jgi:VIT1/CCC1 family predicted Fe2+/Mn2+ transporter
MSGSFSDKIHISENIGALRETNSWQFFIVLGIAISGLAAFVNTYNSWSSINTQLEACIQSGPLQDAYRTQFIVLIVLSILAILVGILLTVFLSNRAEHRMAILILGMIFTGIFGIIYAATIKLQNFTNGFKLSVSWISFAAFIILGIVLGNKSSPPTIST